MGYSLVHYFDRIYKISRIKDIFLPFTPPATLPARGLPSRRPERQKG